MSGYARELAKSRTRLHFGVTLRLNLSPLDLRAMNTEELACGWAESMNQVISRARKMQLHIYFENEKQRAKKKGAVRPNRLIFNPRRWTPRISQRSAVEAKSGAEFSCDGQNEFSSVF
jgi:hypothetical protein